MDSELRHEAVVFGLDNADLLQELYDGDERNMADNRLVDVWPITNDQRLLGTQETIEKDTDKAEIAKLREELTKALELNRTITTTYRELLMRTAEKTPQKSETKRKLCNLLQEELEEKNIYCVNVTSKLNNYKKKYQALKSHLARLQLRQSSTANAVPETGNISHLEKENEGLRRHLEEYRAKEARLLQRIAEAEGRCNSGSPADLADHSLILDKLKTKATAFNRDADKIFESISSLKDVIGDLVGTTPSTNWRDDDGIIIDIPEPANQLEQGRLGKRQPLISEESQPKESVEFQEVEPQSVAQPVHLIDAPEREHLYPIKDKSQSTYEEVLPRQDKKTFPKFDHGSSDDEESSLSSSFKFVPIVEIESKLKQLTEHTFNSSEMIKETPNFETSTRLESTVESEKVKKTESFEPISKKIEPMAEESLFTPVKNSDPSSLTTKEQHPVLPPGPAMWFLPQPTIQKVVVPSFLLTNSSKTSLCLKPVGIQTIVSSKVRKEDSDTLTVAPGIKSKSKTRIPSGSLERAWNYLLSFKLSGIHDQNQRTDFFSIIKSFREESKSVNIKQTEQKSKRKALLEQLLQSDLEVKTYSLKDLIQETGFEASLQDNYHCMVFQSIFFVVFISCFEGEVLSTEEGELINFLLSYRNKSEYLAEKFDKLMEIHKLNKTNPAAKKQTQSSKNYCYHFPLLKVVFNNMMFAMERMIIDCPTDEEFRSDLLSKKRNLDELKDSCLYAMKKLARNDLRFKFLDGLLDYLGAVKRIFQFSRTLNFNMSKIYFDSLKGFFCHKYRNTSHQIVTFLLLNQLNQLDPATIN